MVCKKYQVYDWFRTLDGAKRIDFLNGMLHLCFPLELRFLGSCIEELARKDYSYLKDAEIKANAAPEIQLMRDIGDKVTRSKMIVTLALLASGNHECARYLYDLLNIDIMDLLEKMKSCMDEKIADEFLLLLTMAANHPAFDFQMKTKMSQLYLNAEYKLKQNKILLKESESDLNLFDKADSEQTVVDFQTQSQSLTKSDNKNNISDDCKNPDLQLLKTTLNNIKNNINNTCKQQQNATQEINNNLNKKKNRNKVDNGVDMDGLVNNFDGLLAINNLLNESSQNLKKLNEEQNIVHTKLVDEDDDLPEEEKLNDSLIESINFEGVQTIKGTENYKFIIKIQWSDKTFNEIDKTYSELCEFNKQLINLYPKELSGLMETNQLVLKENQKEDFVKELPLVTDYCSKIASLPKVVCESDFLRSFFRSNLSNSSITIANDSNSPNRQVNVNSNKSHSAQSSAEKKTNKTVNKKLITAESNQNSTTDSLKSEISTHPQNLVKIQSDADASMKNIIESTSTSTTATTGQPQHANTSDPTCDGSKTAVQNETADQGSKQAQKNSSVNTSLVKTKPHATTVSVANIMNPETSSNKMIKNQQQKVSERVGSTDSSIRQTSIPPTPASHQPIPPQQHQHQMLPTGQLINYPYQMPNLYNQHPQIHHQYNTPGSLNQPLHLHTFQPINNMIIGSPPCASPTTTTTNPHSLNNSRSNSPWMMMPPPLPPANSASHSAPGQSQSIPNGQHFYAGHLHQQQPPHLNLRPSSKTGSSSNLKDMKQQQQQQQYYNNNQDDLLLRYALDNSINYNSNMQPPVNTADEAYASLNDRHNNRNIGKISENNLKKNISKSKNNQNTSESLLTTALTNTNNQYNNTATTNQSNVESQAQNNNCISSGSSSGAMSPKPASNNTENTNANPSTSTVNVRSSSSCSSSSYQHTPPPPPSTMLPPPLLPPHSQQHSPSQHANAQAAAIAAYHAAMQQFVVFQNNQKLEQQYPPQGHHLNPGQQQQQLPPNHHLIQITGAGYHQQHHQSGMPSLLLAPLANQAAGNQANYIPVGFPPGAFPPLPHGQQLHHQPPTQKYQSSNQKQHFKNVTTSLQERSQTPPIGSYPSAMSSFINSDDDNNSEQGNNNSSHHKTGVHLPNNHRMHRRSIPTITNFPTKYATRQHNSNSISVSANNSSTTSSSSLTLKNANSGSTSTLVSSTNGVLNSNNNSTSVSPQNQEILNTLVVGNKSGENFHSSQQHSTHSPRPQSKGPSQLAAAESPGKEQQQQPNDDSISVELGQNELSQNEAAASGGKERTNQSNNGPYSGSSTSSSSSSISNNNQTKSPRPPGQHQPQQQQQPINHQNGSLYYAQFNPSFNEGQNVYALRTIGGPAPLHHQSQPNQHSIQQQQQQAHLVQQQQHLGLPLAHQYASYQQPPPPHNMHNQNVQQQQYYNSMQQQQQQNYQVTNGGLNKSSNTNTANSSNNVTTTNCATPTPGSSPNTLSTTISQQVSQQTSNQPSTTQTTTTTTANQTTAPSNANPNYNYATANPQSSASNPQGMDPQQHHLLNPYNLHHMMSLVTNNQQNLVNGQIQAINPNMMMMMMMNPPVPGQLPAGQIINGKQQQPYPYPQFQQYRSLTPNALHQQASSPSMTSNLMLYTQQQQQQQQQHSSRKKLSCYNCGSMNHTASECKEPTLESISQTNQFRLNFKVNNGSSTSNMTGSNTNPPSSQTSESDEVKKNSAPRSSSKTNMVTSTNKGVMSPTNNSKTNEIVSARRSGD